MSPLSDPAAVEAPCTSNGTGVFIPACILDGSALANPAIMSKPHRKRRGSAMQAQSEPQHGSNSGKQLHKQPQQQQQQQQAVGAGPTGAAAGSSTSSSNSSAAKNPFASTPKNIRQQQLLCNLVAAADCFSEGATVALPAVSSTSNLCGVAASCGSPSLDGLGTVPAAALMLQQQQQALLAAAAAAAAGGMAHTSSFDLTRSSSRASMDSSCYYQPRSSCDMASSSCRSSMDRCSSSYSRPSTESTFSCYGRPSAESATGTAAARQSFCQQQQQQMTGVAVGRRTALDLGHVPSLDSRPVSAAEVQQQQRAASLEIARRMSLEVAAPGGQRMSFDNSDLQHWQQQQAAAAHAAPRRDGSNVSSGSTISSCGSLPSPAGLPGDAAAAFSAQQAMLLQLQQQLLFGRLPNSNGMSAAAAAMAGQGLMPDRGSAQAAQAQLQAGLVLRSGSGGSPPAAASSPSAAAAAARLPPVGPYRPGSGGAGSSGSINGHAYEVNSIQQQLQQAMQANQMAVQMAAAAAAGKAASQQQALQALQVLQMQRDSAAWQQLLEQFSQEAADLSGLQAQEQLALTRLAAAGQQQQQQQRSSLDAEVSAASLQQQLEMLQMLQL